MGQCNKIEGITFRAALVLQGSVICNKNHSHTILLEIINLFITVSIMTMYEDFDRHSCKDFCIAADIIEDHRAIELFELKRTLKGHLIQLPCNEQRQLDLVAQSPIQPDNLCLTTLAIKKKKKKKNPKKKKKKKKKRKKREYLVCMRPSVLGHEAHPAHISTFYFLFLFFIIIIIIIIIIWSALLPCDCIDQAVIYSSATKLRIQTTAR